MREMRCLSGSGQLGFRIPKQAFEAGLKKRPHFIGADMGSTDHGPYYLGSGQIAQGSINVKRDLELLLVAGRELGIPVLIGSAGTAGGEPHLRKVVDVIKRVAREKDLRFRMAVIHAEIDKQYLEKKVLEGKVKSLGPVPELSPEEIKRSTRIVGQMGVEPFVEALEQGAEVIIAGRSCDTSIFAAMPLKEGFDPGLAMHMAKIIECTSLCARPGGREAMMGYLRDDHFLLESMDSTKKCTPVSVAAHSLYEQPNPYFIYESGGGKLDLGEVKFEKYNERVVRVSRSRWIPPSVYTVKLEGAAKLGFRYVAMGGIRDPIMTRQIDKVVENVKKTVDGLLRDTISSDGYKLKFHIYGKNGVMGSVEPQIEITSPELFIVFDAVANSEESAKNIASIARYTLLHCSYEGILATAGNLAIPPFAASELSAGEVYEFNVYHVLEVQDPLSLFPIEICEI